VTTSAGTVTLGRDRYTAALAAIAYLSLGWRYRHPPRTIERRIFAQLNHHDNDLNLLRLPQQLGTPWVLPLIGVTALSLHRPHLALIAGCALPAEKALEVGVKELLERKRPAQADNEAQLRDDAPEDGPSYPSGHAAIATATVFILLPYVSPPVLAVGSVVAGMSSAVRIHQGAHFPVDAVGGVLLGLTVAAGLTAVIGRPASHG
jgi:membrane-associated phospholipid phosphatase